MVCNACELTLRAFILILASRQDTMNLLYDHGLVARYTECPTCNRQVELNVDTFQFRCQRRHEVGRRMRPCRFKQSGKRGTWFALSKLKYDDVLYMTLLWLKMPYPRQQFIMRELSCSAHSVVDWASFCREVCVSWSTRTSVPLGGVGVIVEIDEAKFGKRKYNRGRIIEGQWVFGGFERETKRVFLVPVPNRTADTLLDVIRQWILPGTTIVSDFWRSYDTLQHQGFEHLKVNHSLNFVDPQDPRVHTQNIERTWRNVRGGIPRYGRAETHMIGYLAEFLFKRHFSGGDDVHHFLLEIGRMYPPTG